MSLILPHHKVPQNQAYALFRHLAAQNPEREQGLGTQYIPSVERIVGELSRLIKPDGGDRQDQDQLTNEHSQGQRQTFQGYFLLHQPTLNITEL